MSGAFPIVSKVKVVDGGLGMELGLKYPEIHVSVEYVEIPVIIII